MQYCPNCQVQIRGRKAHCPLCERELLTAIPFRPDSAEEENGEAAEGAEGAAAFMIDDDPFVRLPEPKVSFMLMVRIVTFLCISLEIIIVAAQIITGFKHGWLYAAMLAAPVAWADFLVGVYFRSNLIRMLTTQAYLIMFICLVIQQMTHTGSWALTWVVPGMFCLLVAVTFIAAKAQGMELHEFILYPAFDMLFSLLQIIPISLGWNDNIAPAVISIAFMLIVVSSLVIFRGRMLQDAAYKYLHV